MNPEAEKTMQNAEQKYLFKGWKKDGYPGDSILKFAKNQGILIFDEESSYLKIRGDFEQRFKRLVESDIEEMKKLQTLLTSATNKADTQKLTEQIIQIEATLKDLAKKFQEKLEKAMLVNVFAYKNEDYKDLEKPFPDENNKNPQIAFVLTKGHVLTVYAKHDGKEWKKYLLDTPRKDITDLKKFTDDGFERIVVNSTAEVRKGTTFKMLVHEGKYLFKQGIKILANYFLKLFNFKELELETLYPAACLPTALSLFYKFKLNGDKLDVKELEKGFNFSNTVEEYHKKNPEAPLNEEIYSLLDMSEKPELNVNKLNEKIHQHSTISDLKNVICTVQFNEGEQYGKFPLFLRNCFFEPLKNALNPHTSKYKAPEEKPTQNTNTSNSI